MMSKNNNENARADCGNPKHNVKLPDSLPIRLLSGLIFVVLLIAAVWFGKITTAILMSLMAAVASYEFYRMMHITGHNSVCVVGIAIAALYPIAATLGTNYFNIVTLGMILILCLVYVLRQGVSIPDIGLTAFGALYTGLLISAVVWIRGSYIEGSENFPIKFFFLTPEDTLSTLLTLGVFFSIWANDSFAYLFGSMFGKTKLAPKISPNKTVEGFIAGIIGSLIFWLLFQLLPELNMPLIVSIVGGLVCGLVGVVGDLFESRIKRSCGVEDSGTLIPGHGGLLDRIDSMVFVFITAYFVLTIGGVL